jgi:hypothetical protein
MLPTAIFWPMIAHAALVFALYGLLRLRRGEAVASGAVKVADFRDRGTPEPEASRKVLANIANQFELPMLFHVGCLALFATGGVSIFVVAIAWLFTASRYVHTAIHVGGNRIRYRFPAFMVGFAAAALLWVWLALHLAGVV